MALSSKTPLRRLMVELHQTETSAIRHCRREARRLGDVPPARALLAVAEHAEPAMRELKAISDANGLGGHALGWLIGQGFSLSRYLIVDRILPDEASYRFTLIGIEHGVSVITLVQEVARVEGLADLSAWAGRVLKGRAPLLDMAREQVRWFATGAEALAR